MTTKTPELKDIASNLFGPKWDLVREWHADSDEIPNRLVIALENSALAQVMRDIIVEEETTRTADETNQEGDSSMGIPEVLPAYLQAMARNFHQLDAIQHEEIPKPGQIVVVNSLDSPNPDIEIMFHVNRPLVAVLSRPTENADVWAGWVVAPENEKYFSTVWDVHLEEEDRPYLDSLAGVVQVWNPVQVYIPQVKKIIGKLSTKRLTAIHDLQFIMLEMGVEYEESSPIGELREIKISDVTLTVGTPLTSESDVRVNYQILYAEVGAALKQPALIATQLPTEAALENMEVGAVDEDRRVETITLRDHVDNIADEIARLARLTLSLLFYEGPQLAYVQRSSSDSESGEPETKQRFHLGEDRLVSVTLNYSGNTLKQVEIKNNGGREVAVGFEEGESSNKSTKVLGEGELALLNIDRVGGELPDTIIVELYYGRQFRFSVGG